MGVANIKQGQVDEAIDSGYSEKIQQLYRILDGTRSAFKRAYNPPVMLMMRFNQ